MRCTVRFVGDKLQLVCGCGCANQAGFSPGALETHLGNAERRHAARNIVNAAGVSLEQLRRGQAFTAAAAPPRCA